MEFISWYLKRLAYHCPRFWMNSNCYDDCMTFNYYFSDTSHEQMKLTVVTAFSRKTNLNPFFAQRSLLYTPWSQTCLWSTLSKWKIIWTIQKYYSLIWFKTNMVVRFLCVIRGYSLSYFSLCLTFIHFNFWFLFLSLLRDFLSFSDNFFQLAWKTFSWLHLVKNSPTCADLQWSLERFTCLDVFAARDCWQGFVEVITVTSHECHGISSLWNLDCLFNSLIRVPIAKSPHNWPFVRRIHHWLLDSHHKRVSNAANVSLLWHHHMIYAPICPFVPRLLGRLGLFLRIDHHDRCADGGHWWPRLRLRLHHWA